MCTGTHLRLLVLKIFVGSLPAQKKWERITRIPLQKKKRRAGLEQFEEANREVKKEPTTRATKKKRVRAQQRQQRPVVNNGDPSALSRSGVTAPGDRRVEDGEGRLVAHRVRARGQLALARVGR